MWACGKGFIDLVQILLGNASNTHIDLNAIDEEGRTALMWACLNMNYEVVTVLNDLIEKKRFNIHLNIKDNVGETAFMMACRNGQIGIAKLLLKRINIIIPSREEFSGLKFSSDSLCTEIKEMLEEKWAKKRKAPQDDKEVAGGFAEAKEEIILGDRTDMNHEMEKTSGAETLEALCGDMEFMEASDASDNDVESYETDNDDE